MSVQSGQRTNERLGIASPSSNKTATQDSDSVRGPYISRNSRGIRLGTLDQNDTPRQKDCSRSEQRCWGIIGTGCSFGLEDPDNDAIARFFMENERAHEMLDQRWAEKKEPEREGKKNVVSKKIVKNTKERKSVALPGKNSYRPKVADERAKTAAAQNAKRVLRSSKGKEVFVSL